MDKEHKAHGHVSASYDTNFAPRRRCAYANVLAKGVDRLGWNTLPPERFDCRHARVVPPVDVFAGDELDEASLGEDGVFLLMAFERSGHRAFGHRALCGCRAFTTVWRLFQKKGSLGGIAPPDGVSNLRG